MERLQDIANGEIPQEPHERAADRQRLHEMLAAIGATTEQDKATCYLVREASGLLGKVCLEEDDYTEKLIGALHRLQLDAKELRDEVVRVYAPPSPSSYARTSESLHEQLLISDDLAEMLIVKEVELEESQLKTKKLQEQLDEARLQASINARFSSSVETPSPQSRYSPNMNRRVSGNARPSSNSSSLNGSRSAADMERDVEVDRALEEMAVRSHDAQTLKKRVAELEEELTHLSAREKRLSDDNDEVYNKLEILNIEIEEVRAKLACEQNASQHLSAQTAELESETNKMHEIMDALQQELSAKNHEIGKLRADLVRELAISGQHDVQTAALQAEVYKTHGQIASLKQELFDGSAEISKLRASIVNEQAMSGQKEVHAAALLQKTNEQMSVVQIKMTAQSGEIAHLRSDLEREKAACYQLENQKAQFELDVKTMQLQVDGYKRNENRLENVIQEQHEDIDLQRAKSRQEGELLAEALERVSEISALVKSKNAEIETLEKQLYKAKVGNTSKTPSTSTASIPQTKARVHFEDDVSSASDVSAPAQPMIWLSQTASGKWAHVYAACLLVLRQACDM